MTITLMLALAVGLGVAIGRWWALVLPATIGAASAVAISLSGHVLADTPIPFLVIIGTMAVALGVLLRTRQTPRSA